MDTPLLGRYAPVQRLAIIVRPLSAFHTHSKYLHLAAPDSNLQKKGEDPQVEAYSTLYFARIYQMLNGLC